MFALVKKFLYYSIFISQSAHRPRTCFSLNGITTTAGIGFSQMSQSTKSHGARMRLKWLPVSSAFVPGILKEKNLANSDVGYTLRMQMGDCEIFKWYFLKHLIFMHWTKEHIHWRRKYTFLLECSAAVSSSSQRTLFTNWTFILASEQWHQRNICFRLSFTSHKKYFHFHPAESPQSNYPIVSFSCCTVTHSAESWAALKGLGSW